jgi:hypothetical protein
MACQLLRLLPAIRTTLHLRATIGRFPTQIEECKKTTFLHTFFCLCWSRAAHEAEQDCEQHHLEHQQKAAKQAITMRAQTETHFTNHHPSHVSQQIQSKIALLTLLLSRPVSFLPTRANTTAAVMCTMVLISFILLYIVSAAHVLTALSALIAFAVPILTYPARPIAPHEATYTTRLKKVSRS